MNRQHASKMRSAGRIINRCSLQFVQWPIAPLSPVLSMKPSSEASLLKMSKQQESQLHILRGLKFRTDNFFVKPYYPYNTFIPCPNPKPFHSKHDAPFITTSESINLLHTVTFQITPPSSPVLEIVGYLCERGRKGGKLEGYSQFVSLLGGGAGRR